LRSLAVNSFVVDVMAALSIHIDLSTPDVTTIRAGLPGTEGPGETFTAARRFMERRRKGL
jgi:hypothetical protein